MSTQQDTIALAEKELSRISVKMIAIAVTQRDQSTVWFKGIRFGDTVESFTVALTPTGKIKKGSIRFYE